MASSNQTKLKAMTNQHPLTDEKVSDLIEPICGWAHAASMSDYDRILHGTEFDMEADRVFITEEIEIATKIVRDAYDLGREEGHVEMLEAVSRWTKRHAWSYMEQCQYEDDHEFNDSKFIANLKKAMHPMRTHDD